MKVCFTCLNSEIGVPYIIQYLSPCRSNNKKKLTKLNNLFIYPVFDIGLCRKNWLRFKYINKVFEQTFSITSVFTLVKYRLTRLNARMSSQKSQSAFSPVFVQTTTSSESVSSRMAGKISPLPPSSYSSAVSYHPYHSYPPWWGVCQGMACCSAASIDSYHQYATNPAMWPAAMSCVDSYCPSFACQPRLNMDCSRFYEKPTQSYVGLIGQAILDSPEKKLILSDIYNNILTNYPYFRNKGTGWRNSIRHNLSLNDCFIKAGRSPNGKGHFWAINPLYFQDFLNGNYKPRRMSRFVAPRSYTTAPYKNTTLYSHKEDTQPSCNICTEEKLFSKTSKHEDNETTQTDILPELKQVQRLKLDRLCEHELKEMREPRNQKSFDVCNLLRRRDETDFVRQKTSENGKDTL